MLVWILRTVALLGSSVLAYYIISPDWKGTMVGAACGATLIMLEVALESISLMSFIIGVAGAVIGLVMTKLLDALVLQISNPGLDAMWGKVHLLIQFLFMVLGAILALRKTPELDDLDKDLAAMGRRRGSAFKLLDITAIIDGRIIDIADTHFLSGTLVAPRFVVNELHSMAESQDQMKRARGRRGLDILSRLQESKDIPLRVLDKDIPDAAEVDSKLVRLAREMNAQIITTEFNMHKLAALEGVTVLNVNDLSTALKPVVLPGEVMSLFIMKEGKEREQGVGYLDDGTMVVVEEGRRWIGRRIDATVYSILQTSSGRMIFARAKWDAKQQQQQAQQENEAHQAASEVRAQNEHR
ncbi:MAG: hypothetical protein WC421_10110 [Elusimicrobiales bacterium]